MKEKANVQSAAPRKVKGTVLFTVVCVMMVLIVFLMGTLTLAATANNRANAKYQKTQTEAIARTVLDSVAQAIADDDDASGVRSVVVAEGSIPVTLDGVTYTVNVTNTGRTQNYYDIENSTPWQTSPVYQLEVQVDKTKANTTYSAFVTAKTETTGGGGGGGGGGGAFVSMGDTSKVGTGGFITGGTYVGIDNPAPSYTIADNDVYIDAPYYVNASVTTGGGKGLILHYTSPGNMVYINGDMLVTQSNQLKTDYTGFQWNGSTINYTETPYLYVDGRLTVAQHGLMYIGQYGTNASSGNKIPTNLYTGSLYSGDSGMVVYGDIYSYDSTADSVIGRGADDYSAWLYKWAQSNISVTGGPDASALYGNWFSKGNITLYSQGLSEVNGDLRSEKNITLTSTMDEKNFNVSGDIVAGGTLALASETNTKGCTVTAKNVYADVLVVRGTLNAQNVYCNHLVGDGTINCVTFQCQDKAAAVGVELNKKQRYFRLDNLTNGTYPDSVESWKTWYYNEYDLVTVEKCIYTDGSETTADIKSMHVRNEQAYSAPQIPELHKKDGSDDNKCVEVMYYVNTPTDGNAVTINGAQGTIAASPVASGKYGVPSANRDIYPAGYDSTNLKMTLNQPTPVPSDYTSYYTNSSTFTSWGEPITSLSQFQDPPDPSNPSNFTVESDGAGGKYYCVKTDAYFKNIDFDRNVYIDPNGKCRVIFENCKFYGTNDRATGRIQNTSLIVNDKNFETTAYIIGTLSIPNNGCIVTKYYWDSLIGYPLGGEYTGGGTGDTITVTQQHAVPSDDDYPNFIIMSDPGATLDMSGNNTLVTALIRAPQMKFIQSQGFGGAGIKYIEANGSDVYYGSAASGASYDTDNHKLADGSQRGEWKIDKSKLSNTGVIGQLIADDIILSNDKNWGMIFVEIPSTPVPPTPPTPGSTNPFAGESTVLFYDYY